MVRLPFRLQKKSLDVLVNLSRMFWTAVEWLLWMIGPIHDAPQSNDCPNVVGCPNHSFWPVPPFAWCPLIASLAIVAGYPMLLPTYPFVPTAGWVAFQLDLRQHEELLQVGWDCNLGPVHIAQGSELRACATGWDGVLLLLLGFGPATRGLCTCCERPGIKDAKMGEPLKCSECGGFSGVPINHVRGPKARKGLMVHLTHLAHSWRDTTILLRFTIMMNKNHEKKSTGEIHSRSVPREFPPGQELPHSNKPRASWSVGGSMGEEA